MQTTTSPSSFRQLVTPAAIRNSRNPIVPSASDRRPNSVQFTGLFDSDLFSNDSNSQRSILPERPVLNESLFSNDSTSQRSILPERPVLNESLFSNDSTSQRSILPKRPVLNESLFSNDSASQRSKTPSRPVRTLPSRNSVSDENRATAEELFNRIYINDWFMIEKELEGIVEKLNPDVAVQLAHLFQDYEVPEDEVSQICLNQRTAGQKSSKICKFWRAFDASYPWVNH